MKIIISEEMLKEIVRTELNEWKDYRLVNPGTTTNTPSSNYHFTNFSKWDLGNAFTTFSLDKENGGSVNGKMTISASQAGVSPAMLQKICQLEKSKNFGYKMGEKDLAGINLGDANGHLTYGYGLLFHPNGQYMDTINRRWSQDELESLYMQTVKKISDEVRSWARQKK